MCLLLQANLLLVANIVAHGMPVFNATTITAMVDRWRPETHTFHLPCGKIMVTLEHMVMILRILIRGWPITDHVESSMWCERVGGFLGRESSAKVSGVKG
jgi:hypothetical protein